MKGTETLPSFQAILGSSQFVLSFEVVVRPLVETLAGHSVGRGRISPSIGRPLS